MKKIIFVIISISLVGCATIVNDANIPLAFSFSDGSGGSCTFKNKRGAWESDIPTKGVYIRRSDDALIYDCKTRDGRESTGSIRSEMEGGKLAASVIFWDLGITDAITDKHRTYQGNVVIPVEPLEEVAVKEKMSSETGTPENSDSVKQDTFKVKCSGCGNIISYKAEEAGTIAKCTQCGKEVELL